MFFEIIFPDNQILVAGMGTSPLSHKLFWNQRPLLWAEIFLQSKATDAVVMAEMARKERLDSFVSNMGLPSFQTEMFKLGIS